MPAILVTGGAGYIGTHVCVALLRRGFRVVVVDDLSNSSRTAVARVRELAPGALTFYEVDVRNGDALDRVLDAHTISAAIHLAGLKAVAESVADPLRYFDVNVAGTISLVSALDRHNVRSLVFSSSATVYGAPETVPVTEAGARSAANPYGQTKLVAEDFLTAIAVANPAWRIALLRYFNPVGAHPSGFIGEDPSGVPQNLLPYLMQVAVGRRPELVVHGNDYPTRDGTCVRDYVHVEDLADGHLAALYALPDGCQPINLGTGAGSTVLEVIAAASAAIGRPVPYRIGPRRPGDVAATYADPSLAADLLGWHARRTLPEMCADAWRWQSQNPGGYRG